MDSGKSSDVPGLGARHVGIVYFDGVCGICNGFVDFLLTRDDRHVLKYAPLQGQTAKERLEADDLKHISTIIYQEGDKIYRKSDAVFKTLARLGGGWRLLPVLRIIPRFIRDTVYAYIAANRYRWFGKKELCRMPTTDERNKILP